MTYLQIRQRIAELMGMSSIDRTPDDNATMEDKFKAWVNARYKALAAKESWNWLINDSIVQTVPDISTGTITATTDSTTITFTSGPTASVAGYFIQFSDSGDWYEIATHTAGSTTAILDVPFVGITSSVLKYVLRKVYYLLPADTGKILNISQHRVWNTALRYVPARLLDQYLAYRQQTNRPRFYSIIGIDSNRQYKMELFPTPNVRMNLNVRRYQIITEMVSDSDIPIIPEAYHEILVWDVLSTYGFTFLDDTRISAAKAEYNTLYNDMKKNHVDVEDIAVRLAYDIDLSGVNNALGYYDLPVQP
jgi:hypothetical protein